MTAIAHGPTTLGRAHAPAVVAHQVRYVLAEARPVVQVVFLLRLLAATGLLARYTARELFTVGGWSLLVVAIYVFNGVTDLRADAANGSRRPIASGRLGRATALRWCAGTSAAGLALCALVGPALFGVAAAMAAAGWAYSDGPALKNRPVGFALVVGLGAALTYLAGWLAAGALHLGALAVMLAMACWVGLCCASKDFSDVAGDRLAGRHTWPVMFGPARAARLLAVVAVSCGLAALVGSIVGRVSIVPACVVLAGSVLLAGTAVVSAAVSDRAVRRRPYRVFLATQYAVNVAFILAAVVG